MQQSQQMPELLEQIRRAPGLVEGLPSQEGAIVRAALDGQDVYAIAATYQTSEANVWNVLGRAARAASGADVHQVESGGLGSLGDEPDPSTPADLARARGETATPQTRHPSQAEGDDGAEEGDFPSPQTRHPSQAEGDEGS